MFSNLNFWEIAALALLGLFIFGPERLPKVISDAARMMRNLRDMARNATADLSRELGTEVRLEDLHPRTFVRKHLLSEEEERRIRRPFDEAVRDITTDARGIAADARGIAADANDFAGGRPRPEPPAAARARGDGDYGDSSHGGEAIGGMGSGDDHGYGQVRHPYPPDDDRTGRFDSDAT